MIKIGALLLLGVVFTAFLISNTEGTAQRITLYNSTGCSTSGRNGNVSYTSTTNIGAAWDNATLSFKFVGMWRLNATAGRNSVVITPTNAGSNNQCINKANAIPGNATSYKLTRAERIGPADMTTNQLILYSQQNFGGTSKSALGNDTTFNMQAQSYVHFGKAAWLVYSTKNFTGTAVCLKHATNGNGDTYTHMLAMRAVPAMSVQMIANGTCPNGATNPGPGPGPNPSTSTTTTKKPGGGGGGGSASNVANILLTAFLMFSAMAFTNKS